MCWRTFAPCLTLLFFATSSVRAQPFPAPVGGCNECQQSQMMAPAGPVMMPQFSVAPMPFMSPAPYCGPAPVACRPKLKHCPLRGIGLGCRPCPLLCPLRAIAPCGPWGPPAYCDPYSAYGAPYPVVPYTPVAPYGATVPYTPAPIMSAPTMSPVITPVPSSSYPTVPSNGTMTAPTGDVSSTGSGYYQYENRSPLSVPNPYLDSATSPQDWAPVHQRTAAPSSDVTSIYNPTRTAQASPQNSQAPASVLQANRFYR